MSSIIPYLFKHMSEVLPCVAQGRVKALSFFPCGRQNQCSSGFSSPNCLGDYKNKNMLLCDSHIQMGICVHIGERSDRKRGWNRWETDRQTDRQTDRETDGWTERHVNSRTQKATVVPSAKGWRGSCFADKSRYMPCPPSNWLFVLRVGEHSTQLKSITN